MVCHNNTPNLLSPRYFTTDVYHVCLRISYKNNLKEGIIEGKTIL